MIYLVIAYWAAGAGFFWGARATLRFYGEIKGRFIDNPFGYTELFLKSCFVWPYDAVQWHFQAKKRKEIMEDLLSKAVPVAMEDVAEHIWQHLLKKAEDDAAKEEVVDARE